MFTGWSKSNATSSASLNDWQKSMQKCTNELKEALDKLNKENAEALLIKDLFRSINLALTFELEKEAHLENANRTIIKIQESRPDLKVVMDTFKETFQNINLKKPKNTK